MKYLQSGYKGDSNKLLVQLFNDLHIGAPSANTSLLDSCISNVLAYEHCSRILINGDLIDGVLKTSKGDIYAQTMSPKEQVDYLVDKFMPVRHLIDAISTGNHDYRVKKETSFDPIETFARYLGIQDRYIGDRGIVGFSWNNHFYSVEMHHGTGGASTLGAIENNMKKIWKSDSDVMYCGHWHKEFAKPIKRFSIDPRNKKVREDKRWMVCGNTILNTAEYAIKGAFEESFPSQAVLILNGKRNTPKEIDVQWMRD